MKNLRLPAAVLVLAVLMVACSLPTPAPPYVDLAATLVVQTMQALSTTQPLIPIQASPLATNVPPTSVPTSVSSVLPHSLYFLNNGKDGIVQIFRLETDGKTVHQITFEPANVSAFDVSPKNGDVAYVSNNQLLWVDANGSGRRTLLDGGPVNDNNRFTNSVGTPVWNPGGGTIAFSYGGLNFYSISSGTNVKLLDNKIDNSAGFRTCQPQDNRNLYG